MSATRTYLSAVTRKRFNAAVASLFVDGAGRTADHLVLTNEKQNVFGGWSQRAMEEWLWKQLGGKS